MTTLTKSLARVALAFEAGKISRENATTLCHDLMRAHEYMLAELLSYEVATSHMKYLLNQAGISVEE